MNGYFIVLILLAIGGIAFFLAKQSDKKDKEKAQAYRPPPPPRDVTPTPPPAAEKPVEVVVNKPVVEPDPIPHTPTPGPVPSEPVPKGDDSQALYNFTVARKTKKINIADMRNLGARKFGDNSMQRVPNAVFRFEGDPSFTANIAKTSQFNKSVLYLCDKDGNVKGFCISAAGAKKSEKSIAYQSGSFAGGAYIVQTSDGSHSGAQYNRKR